MSSQLREIAASSGLRLPELLRASWALVDRTGLNARQAGEVLDLSPAMVSSRVHRARLRIREDLTRHVAGAPKDGGPGKKTDGNMETGPDGRPGTGPGSGSQVDAGPGSGEKDRT